MVKRRSNLLILLHQTSLIITLVCKLLGALIAIFAAVSCRSSSASFSSTAKLTRRGVRGGGRGEECSRCDSEDFSSLNSFPAVLLNRGVVSERLMYVTYEDNE